MSSSSRIFAESDCFVLTGLRRWLWLAGAICCCALFTRSVQADNWALLIGTSGEYKDSENWHRLSFAENDVNDLKNVLAERGNYEGRITVLLNKNHEELARGIREFFKQRIEPGDLVMLYYSGHGYSKNEQLYFVPVDFDLKQPDATGVNVGELREQLKECSATNKVFIIDSCHAGTEFKARNVESASPADRTSANVASDSRDELSADQAKRELDSAVDAKGATAEQVQNVFRGKTGVVLLASSQGTQSSYPINGNEHSLFTFWLIEGLKGHADKDANGNVTIDEVNEFVGSYVSEIARTTLGERQNPVREIGVNVPNDQPMVLSELTERWKDDLLKDMAELIGRVVSVKRLGPVTVYPDFATLKLDAGDTSLVPDRKPLSKDLAFTLDAEMQKQSKRFQFPVYQFPVFSDERRKMTGPSDLASLVKGNVTKGPAGKGDADKFVLVQGIFKQLSGNFVALRAEAYLLGDDGAMVPIATAGGRASLTQEKPGLASNQIALNEYPATGRSAVVEVGDTAPLRVAGKDISGVAAAAERWNSEERLASHPLADSNFDFPIVIRSRAVNGQGGWREQTPYCQGNDAYVELNPGEEYGIEVSNRYDTSNGDHVLVKILVDGLSIFDQAAPDRFVASKGRTKALSKDIAVRVMKVAHPSSIAEASAWPLAEGRETLYRGFYIGTGGDYCPFEVVESTDSWAAQRGLTRSIGVITIVFYKDSGMSLGPGTRGGAIVRGPELVKTPVGKAGDTLAFVNIRYVSKSELQQIKRQSGN